MKHLIIAICTLLVLSPAYATKVTEKDVSVTKIMTDAEFFGGCMAFLSPSPHLLLPGCNANWVTFSCSGEFLPKDVSSKLYSAAQLTYVTGTKATVRINDAKKHNGYCLAERFDNTP